MSSDTAGRILIGLLAVGVSTISSAQPSAAPPASPPSVAPVSRDVLSVVPADAGMVVVVRDLAGLDASLAGLMDALGTPASPLAFVQRSLGIVSGFDIHGSAALAVMPAEPGAAMSAGLVLIVPTTNRKELLAFLNPDTEVDGLVRVVVRGKDTYVGHRGDFTLFAPTASMARRVMSAPKSIETQLSDDQRSQIGDMGISAYVDPEAFARTGIGRRFAGWVGAQGVPFATFGRSTGVLVTAQADAGGVSFVVSVQHDAATGQQPGVDTSSFLRGHLQEPYGLAMDVAVSPAGQARHAAIDAILAKATRSGLVRSDRVGALRSAIHGVLNQAGRVSATVTLLPGESGPQLGLSLVLAARNDATLLVRAIEDAVRTLKTGLLVDQGYNLFLQRLSWLRAAESLENVTIDQLRLPLNDLPSVDQEKAATLFTPSGLVLRVGTVDNRHVVIAMGGGAERYRGTVANLRSSQTPMASDIGIQRLRMHLPTDRYGEGFVALDRLMPIWCHLTDVLSKKCQLPRVPPMNAAFAFYTLEALPTSTVFGGFAPVELLAALRDAASVQGAEKTALPGVTSNSAGP